jgi:acyl-CoA reductase-like NAD-dependent aldehyde dehydrogenase
MASRSQTLGSVDASSARFIESINPVTSEVMARIAATPASMLPDIFRRAREEEIKWASLGVRERCKVLRRLRGAIFDARDEVVEIVSRESGKPRVEAIFTELLLALDTADFLARRGPEWLRPERVPHHNLAVKAKSGWLEYQPHGVVAVISPWNYPFSIPMSQVIAAVAGGNAVLLKPSELTPATGALVAELFARAGFPNNLVQVVQGGGDIGAALIEAGPDKVFFTGSVATGKRIAQVCATKLIPSVLELGGKDAMIVLADADLDTASSAAVWGGFTNCGQACLSVERIYVEEPVARRFIDLCVGKTKKLRVGPPSDLDAEIGPMIRLRQLEKVEELLRDAVDRGAKILTGGHRRSDLGPNFLEPAVVANVDHSMKLMREETFGPVIAIRTVVSAAEAVEMANDSPFGLSASVWTGDSRRGREMASRLHAGSVMVNDVASYYGICEAPHGGRGASGWGRTHSRFGLLEMVQVKYVDVDHLPSVGKSWWFGYSSDLGQSASQFVEGMFAPNWRRRLCAWGPGALGVVFRRNRI